MTLTLIAFAMVPTSNTVERVITIPVVETQNPVYLPIPAPPPLVRRGEGPPVPKGNPGTWASTMDYPASALRDEREGTTGFSVTVGSDGLVKACEITSSSGHADLDSTTCTNVTRRARFYPAQDKAGKPIDGKYANRVRWQIPGTQSVAIPSFEQSLPKAPSVIDWKATQLAREDYPADSLAAGEQGAVGVRLDIATDGKVSNCAVDAPNSSKSLNEKSCAIARNWLFKPARDVSGNSTTGQVGYRFQWRLPKGATALAVSASRTARPRFNIFEKTGNLMLAVNYDAEGKMTGCSINQNGGLENLIFPKANAEAMCQSTFGRENIVPFLNADGKAEARKVILKVSVEHAAPDAK